MPGNREKDTSLEAKINKLKLVHYIAVEMNRPHDMKALLELILERCLSLTGADTGSVMLINNKEKVLDIVASKGLEGEVASSTRLKLGEGITGWVAQSGNPKLVNNANQDPLYVKVREDLLSELAVPIKTEDRAIGVVSVDSNSLNAFNEDDLELMTMVSELAAQIIMKDEMKDKLESKIKFREILIESFKIIEEQEELKDVFEKIMELLAEKMGVQRGMLVLFDPDEPGSLKINAGYRISGEAMKKGIYRIGEGIIGNVVLTGQAIAVEDISKDPMFLNKMEIKRTGMGQVSFIASSIKAGKTVLGVLAAEKKYDESEMFSDVFDSFVILTSMLAYRVRSYTRQQDETKKLVTENIELMKELRSEYSFKNIIGKNEKIRKVMEQVKTVSGTPAAVLITGETGTGKEMIAKILHFLSERRDKKFVSVNCAAIPENLLESELFGYEKGAFTGASGNKKGRFELADSGTLFLDEIGELPLPLQSKILRALQEKEIEPLGSEKSVKVDIRIIAATNRDLKKEVDAGRFRPDLFFRLNVINVNLPPLRERADDIPLLAEFFVKKYSQAYNRKVAGIDRKVEEFFGRYEWPGNIRELENVIERAVIMSKGNIIDMSLLPENMSGPEAKAEGFDLKRFVEDEAAAAPEGEVYEKVIGRMEKTLIEGVLVRTNNNKLQAAKMLGINRNTLKTKMREYNIS